MKVKSTNASDSQYNIESYVSENCGKHAIKYFYLTDLIFYSHPKR